MKQKYIFGIVALAMIAVLGISMVSAFGVGNNGFFNQNLSEEEKTAMQEQAQAIQTAIENEDFATWKSLMESQLTEENFNQLVEANKKTSEIKTIQDELKQAVEDGDTETANELKAKLFDLMPERNFDGEQLGKQPHTPSE